MDESQDNDLDPTSPDDVNMKDDSSAKILPAKSKEKYEAVYQHFTAWQASKNLNSWSESVLLTYFNELVGKVKPPTLWARYSMLKSTIKMNNNIDIRDYEQLSALLRKASKGYKSQKPKTLSSEEILQFLSNAPDHNYLATKVAVVFSICGALKKGELCEIRTSNINDFGTHLVVKVPNSETKGEKTFFVHGELFYNLYKSYAALRPPNIATSRFFLNYNYGKCTQQVIGINKFGSMPKQVAKYLNLPESECYTGHSIRRTSASLLSDLGAVPALEGPYYKFTKRRNTNQENPPPPPPLIRPRIEKPSLPASTSNNAEDTSKTVLIFGVFGAMRNDEMTNVQVDHIKELGNLLQVELPKTKTLHPRSFVISEACVKYVKEYQALRPKILTTNRFFLNYQNGKCTSQVIGKNKFSGMPKQIAEFLNLPDPGSYTGHCFRRTSAKVLVVEGANMEILKSHRGWKSSSVAENYTAESFANKRKIGDMIQSSLNLPTDSYQNLESGPSTSKRLKENDYSRLETFASKNNDLNSENKAKDSWLDRFKQQNVFRIIEKKGDNAESAKVSKVSIHYENLSLDNLYNADESRICWRPLNNSGHNDSEDEDNITALFCANATGSHRIPLLTIGNSEEPECFRQLISPELKSSRLKFFKSLNVAYTHENRSEMDKHIFLLWYKDIFIPNVIKYQEKSGTTGKVILMIDNEPCHPTLNELNAINKNFQVLPLPSKVTAANQPMNQGLISLTRKQYKNNLLKQALLSRQGAENYLKKFNLTDCLQFLGEAWDNLDSATLKKVWKTFLAESSANSQNSPNNNSTSTEIEESTSFLQNKGDQLSQFLTESNWSTQESKEQFLNWFNDEKTTTNENPRQNCEIEKNSETNDADEMRRNYTEMKNDFAELRNEFAELRSKFIEIKNELKCENRLRTRKVTAETFEDSMNFEDCADNEFLPIKDEIEDEDNDDDDNDNDDEDVENIEIEESKSFLEESEKITVSDALTHFNQLKTWMKLSKKFDSKHFDYLAEIENIMREEM